jgi:hypothetical protein
VGGWVWVGGAVLLERRRGHTQLIMAKRRSAGHSHYKEHTSRKGCISCKPTNFAGTCRGGEVAAHASGAGNQGAKKAKTALGFDI